MPRVGMVIIRMSAFYMIGSTIFHTEAEDQGDEQSIRATGYIVSNSRQPSVSFRPTG